MRFLSRPVRALLLASVALLLRPDSVAIACPPADLNEDGLYERVEISQLTGGASAWGDHARSVEFRLNDNDDPSVLPSTHVSRFQVERNPQRPRSRRRATTVDPRTRVPRGPPLLPS